jgi:hypothetical protein
MTLDNDHPLMLAASKIRVKSLLANMPFTGRIKTNQVIAESGVDPKLTLKQLCAPASRGTLTRLIQSLLDRIPSLRLPRVLGMDLKPSASQ